MKKGNWITIIIISLVIILSYFVMTRSHPETPEAIAKCIGENSVVYSQLGCHACESQKDLFGENYKYINDFVCNTNWQKCQELEISGTPTWIIKDKKYSGVQSIEKLRELTGC